MNRIVLFTIKFSVDVLRFTFLGQHWGADKKLCSVYKNALKTYFLKFMFLKGTWDSLHFFLSGYKDIFFPK